MDLDASLYWLALTVTPGLGARLTSKLLRHFGSPEAVFRARLFGSGVCAAGGNTAGAALVADPSERISFGR